MLVMEMKCIRPFDTKLIELEIQEIDSINISPGCEFFFYRLIMEHVPKKFIDSVDQII